MWWFPTWMWTSHLATAAVASPSMKTSTAPSTILTISTNFEWVTNSYDVALLDINNDGLTTSSVANATGTMSSCLTIVHLVATSADYDLDGIPDACDACPTNPSPDCSEEVDYPVISTDNSMARQWNEMLLESIRGDYARPTVHARNLWHSSYADVGRLGRHGTLCLPRISRAGLRRIPSAV